MLCPLDRNRLFTEILQKQKNYDYYMEACLTDELFTKSVLSGIKLCDKLGIFENILSTDAE